MGAGASTTVFSAIEEERAKPVDASDIQEIGQAKAEIARMRQLLAEQPTKELLYFPVSFNSMVVWLLVTEGKTGHKLTEINLMKGEHMTPEFLAKNPLHCVPALQDDEGCFNESNTILRYLCLKYNLTQFYPSDLKERTHTDMALDFKQTRLTKAMANLTYGRYGFAAKTAEDEAAGKKLLEEKLYPYLIQHLLGERKFVGGARPSIADFALVPTLFQSTVNEMLPLPDRLATYVADFAQAVPAWEVCSAPCAGYIAMQKKKAADAAAAGSGQDGGEPAAE